jgi:hypothetical protein
MTRAARGKAEHYHKHENAVHFPHAVQYLSLPGPHRVSFIGPYLVCGGLKHAIRTQTMTARPRVAVPVVSMRGEVSWLCVRFRPGVAGGERQESGDSINAW